jgi:ATP-dependent DNA helicase RecQ
LERVIVLPATEIRQIQEVMLALPEEQKNSLKPVFETFGGVYSYGVLRCIKAQLNKSECLNFVGHQSTVQ